MVDYKTAEGSDEKVKASGYEMQLTIYAFAVQQLLGKAPKQGVLYFLKNQWSYKMDFDQTALQNFQKEFQALQESLLETGTGLRY